MRRALIAAMVLLAAGCESRRHRLKRLQMQRRIELEVVQSYRPPVVNAAVLAKEQPLAGVARAGRVRVEYPLGMEALAQQLARLIEGMYQFVEERTSIQWSFDVLVRLIRVDEPPAASVGSRVRVARDTCQLRLFVPVDDETLAGVVCANRLFPYSFVHEMTELSLIFPTGGRSPLLADAMMDDKRLMTCTRWLREGLANYAGELVTRDYCHADHRQILHPRPYSALHDAGHLLAGWTAFSNLFQEGRYEKTYYNAALGMVLQIVHREGRDGLRRILDDLANEDLADGSAIKRVMKRHVGQTPTALARSFRMPFLGIDPRDLTRARAKSLGIDAPGGVVILKTQLFSPARTVGLQPNDVILACNGRVVHNASELERALVASGIGAPARLSVWRSGRERQIVVKPVKRPKLDLEEERLL